MLAVSNSLIDMEASESCEKNTMVNMLVRPKLMATGIPIAMKLNNMINNTMVLMSALQWCQRRCHLL